MTDITIEPNLDEPRLMEESGVEARVRAVIEPVIKPLGYRLVRIRLSGLNGLTLQIMAERADGSMSIEDCEVLSRTVSPVLDVEDLIERQYHLEVSSPGIDRPLVRKSDFAMWHGHIIKAETTTAIEGKRKFRGKIMSVDADGFVIETDKATEGEELSVRIPFAELGEARLILTDELIRDALHKDKVLREQQTPDETFEIETEDNSEENR
ncbi:MAG: Ribosome maturation factor RimP [Candidatus Tokpelaia hoelldobleri]|uniref:Ribosome maturation factor RimP n=1 Tax=Candidatus Tokpelaia hoelldobleri TaxID=1902579 RepID=A0A1U9JW86_9HYPH|nr:MAG: Ribosome maturation factor RimP [Candidatus Tokpelaia hoelldoblerii]